MKKNMQNCIIAAHIVIKELIMKKLVLFYFLVLRKNEDTFFVCCESFLTFKLFIELFRSICTYICILKKYKNKFICFQKYFTKKQFFFFFRAIKKKKKKKVRVKCSKIRAFIRN